MNRLSYPNESVRRILRIGPPVAEFAATEVGAGFIGRCPASGTVVDKLLPALDEAEVLPWIVINGKLGVFILWVVSPRALHQD
jgi:hypothetical protein